MAKKKFQSYQEYVEKRNNSEIETIKSEVNFEQRLIDNGFNIQGYKFLYDASVYLIEKDGITLEARHTRINRKNMLDAQLKWVVDCFEMKKKLLQEQK